eukprot:1179623-Prorocentrum_minimum.AAC.9
MLPKRLVRAELRSQATPRLSSGLYIQRSVVDGGITGSDRPSLDSVDQHYLELHLDTHTHTPAPSSPRNPRIAPRAPPHDPPESPPPQAIAEALKGSERLILATDPDREGEAISWHVQAILRERDLLRNVD